MDRLHSPSRVVPTFSAIPYLEHESERLDLWETATQISHRVNHIKPNSPTARLAPFVQTWLLFGLLAESFGCAHAEDSFTDEIRRSIAWATPWVYNEFAQSSADGQHIDTKHLLSLLQISWVRSLHTQNKSIVIAKCTHLVGCLEVENNVLFALPWDHDQTFLDSIVSVAELLSYPILYYNRMFDLGLRFMFRSIGAHLSSQVRRRMLNAGWCPSDITRMQGVYSSEQTFQLLSLMRKPQTIDGRDHADCNDSECLTLNVDMDNYPLRHVDPNCRCNLLGPRSEHVVAALNNLDCIPLLSISGDTPQNINIAIVPSSPETSYTALSHVWRDGLGNPNQTSLYRCQLLRIKNLVLDLHWRLTRRSGRSSDCEASPVPLIWLDTLCCPIIPLSAKTKAIEKLRAVYSKANRVLVLDSGLQQIPVNGWNLNRVPRANSTYPIELLLYIYTCGWIRRLWTLQEGALARAFALHFQFSDTTITIEELNYTLYSFVRKSCYFEGLLFDTGVEFNSLRRFFQSEANGLTPFSNLVRVDKALMYRSASVRSDEPLCIAALLSLDVAKIAEISLDDEASKQRERMKKVWELIAEDWGGIPATVLFVPSPQRLHSFGWRWAPATFLEAPHDTGLEVRSGRWKNKPIAKFNQQIGLSVQFPGFLLSKQECPDLKPFGNCPWWNALPFRSPFRSELPVIIHDSLRGVWIRIYHNGSPLESEEELQRGPTYHRSRFRKLISQGNCAVIANCEYAHGSFVASDQSTSFFSMGGDVSTDRFQVLPPGRHSAPNSLRVQFEHYVTLSLLTTPEIRVYSTIDRLAAALEHTPVALALANARTPNDAGHREALEAVKNTAKVMMEEEYGMDNLLKPAVAECLGEQHVQHVYHLIGDWYHCNRDIRIEQLPNDQIWDVN